MSDLRARLNRLEKRLDPDPWHDAWMPEWARALRRKPTLAIPNPDGSIPETLTQEEADRLNAAGFKTLFIPLVDDRPRPDSHEP
jgi:hypothetical protein